MSYGAPRTSPPHGFGAFTSSPSPSMGHLCTSRPGSPSCAGGPNKVRTPSDDILVHRLRSDQGFK